MITLPERYKPVGNTASGGMSHARVCVDAHLDRNVLVKELQAGVDQRRILDEVSALTAIRSKHVVQIYDVIKDRAGQVVGIVEEFISGAELTESAPITDLNEFLRVGYAMACGIADIHQAGRVHRDIKPNNIRFDAEGCLKIYDFGLARDGRVAAATIGAVGTPGFMAPELWGDDDEVVEFDSAIDVYAFGATMLMLALGRLPAPLRRWPPTLPCDEADFANVELEIEAEIATVLNSCLEADPSERPRMADVRDVLALHLLRDRHRATLVVHNAAHVLGADRRSVQITLPGGVAQIRYDGLRFSLTPVSGQVYLNNVLVQRPAVLHPSCVITFGGPDLGWRRVHVSVDVSHPEVVL